MITHLQCQKSGYHIDMHVFVLPVLKQFSMLSHGQLSKNTHRHPTTHALGTRYLASFEFKA